MDDLWLPVRAFELSLEATDAETGQPVQTGGTSRTTVKIIVTQQWPSPGAEERRPPHVFWEWVWQVAMGNWLRETWWFIGAMLRAFDEQIVDAWLLLWLTQSMAKASPLEAMLVGGIKLTSYLVWHYSANWFSVQGPICCIKPWYWLFSRWACLPPEQCRSTAVQKLHVFCRAD